MTQTPPVTPQDIRRRAEELFSASESIITESTSPEEMKQILYELRVHQIQLEMQNDELRRAHEELDATKARYFDLYDLAPVGYLTLSDKKIIREINLTAASLLGAVRSKLATEPISRILLKDDQNIFYQRLKQCMDESTPQAWEMRLLRADGELFWAHLQATPAENGECWISLNDITDRKQAEHKMQRLTNLYASLSECSKAMVHCKSEEELFQKICFDAIRFGGMHMVWVGLTDIETGVIRVVASAGSGVEYLQNIEISVDAASPFGCGPTGISIREKRPIWCQDFQNDPTTDPWHERALHYSLKSSGSLPLYRAGIVVGALNLYSDEIDAFDEAARSLLVDMAADISYALNNFAREAELRLNQRHVSRLFEISQHPFTNEQEFLEHSLNEVLNLTSSSIGYIYFYNEQRRQFTLNTWSKGVMGECTVRDQQTVYDLDSTGIWGEAVRQRKPILLNDYKALNPLKKGVPEGHAPLSRFLTVPILVDGEIVAVVGVANKEKEYDDADVMQMTLFMDAVWKISAKKRTEEEKNVLEQQFQQAQKLESLGVLAGGIAHDFNNILTVIICNCTLLHKRPQMADELVPEIEIAAQRAADLCRQMLIYAGKAQPLPTRVNMTALVDEMAKMLRATINKNVAIKLVPSADIPMITADASQIRQVVMNLIINAAEAIDAMQGEIRVALTKTAISEEQREKDHLGNVIKPGWYVFLEVKDNGCGMDDETRRRIFEPFYTTKFTGRGLGMSAVLGIIKAHDGALQLLSQPGQGTTFKVYLPLQFSETAVVESLPPVSSAPWKGSGTILLVEDEPQLIMVAKMLLKAFGFSVIEAVNGKEALELYRKNTEYITLVMTDVGMPVMDGYVLFHELKKINPDLPIIFTSGFGDVSVTSQIQREDMAGILSKPYTFDQLREVLRSVLDCAKGES